ncbi:MAG: Gfo/Idh/MocA family oxidoreductase, partial [Candidatus Pacebacteria bacterium]|nr:Gfo/Idh/MocA family oxidoreductase [Candidatus Paceibacterota bacterium]
MHNLLLIGLGYHSRRIYFPILQDFQKQKKVNKIFIIDLKSQEKIIKDYLSEKNGSNTELILLDRAQNIKLDKGTGEKINLIVKKNNIKGVIIATEPLAHMVYARWALREGLSILMDKPLSTYESIVSSSEKAKKLIKDYDELLKLYKQSLKKNSDLVFYLMAQRRAHPFFRKIKESITDVYNNTNCPITSIQAY